MSDSKVRAKADANLGLIIHQVREQLVEKGRSRERKAVSPVPEGRAA